MAVIYSFSLGFEGQVAGVWKEERKSGNPNARMKLQGMTNDD
jgi:hypothetical protein